MVDGFGAVVPEGFAAVVEGFVVAVTFDGFDTPGLFVGAILASFGALLADEIVEGFAVVVVEGFAIVVEGFAVEVEGFAAEVEEGFAVVFDGFDTPEFVGFF